MVQLEPGAPGQKPFEVGVVPVPAVRAAHERVDRAYMPRILVARRQARHHLDLERRRHARAREAEHAHGVEQVGGVGGREGHIGGVEAQRLEGRVVHSGRQRVGDRPAGDAVERGVRAERAEPEFGVQALGVNLAPGPRRRRRTCPRNPNRPGSSRVTRPASPMAMSTMRRPASAGRWPQAFRSRRRATR